MKKYTKRKRTLLFRLLKALTQNNMSRFYRLFLENEAHAMELSTMFQKKIAWM